MFHLYLPSNEDGTWTQVEGENSEEYKKLTSVFSTPRAAIDYIMDTFTTKKKNDIRNYGSYLTKDKILEFYDLMQ